MISIKSKREIELLKIAGNIVYKTHQHLIPFLKEGITTKELDKISEVRVLLHLLKVIKAFQDQSVLVLTIK